MDEIKVSSGDLEVSSRYKVDITKNTKGYNYTISAKADKIEDIQKDVETLHKWAEENYGSPPK
jgi:hypothetical protein